MSATNWALQTPLSPLISQNLKMAYPTIRKNQKMAYPLPPPRQTSYFVALKCLEESSLFGNKLAFRNYFNMSKVIKFEKK